MQKYYVFAMPGGLFQELSVTMLHSSYFARCRCLSHHNTKVTDEANQMSELAGAKQKGEDKV